MFILALVLPQTVTEETYKTAIFAFGTRDQSLTVMSFHMKRQIGVFKSRICQFESSKGAVRQVADVAEAIC